MPLDVCFVCGSRSADQFLHHFPRNETRRKLWLDAMNLSDMDGSVSIYHRICGFHFAKTSYATAGSRQLNRNAIPCLHPFSRTSDSQPEKTASVSAASLGIQPPSASNETFDSEAPTTATKKLPATDNAQSFINDPQTLSFNSPHGPKVLMGIIKKKKDHLRKLKKICKERRNRIKELLKLDEATLVKDIFKGMSSSTVTFMLAQMRCSRRAPKGRRWENDEKILALALYKRSPKCYSLLRNLVAMPSPRTLRTLLSKLSFNPGINPVIFQHLDLCLKAQQYDVRDRLCTLMFDEMSIREHIQYNTSSGRIEGLENFGVLSEIYSNGHEFSGENIANHALVFMAQGIRRKWKQPVAYYFSHGPVCSDVLQVLMDNVLDAMADANLHVVSLICDMGSTNVRTYKLKGSTVSEPYIYHRGRQIFTMFDPPHLLKCTRNLFRSHNVSLPVKVGENMVEMTAKWEDIRTACTIDQSSPLVFRSLPKIKTVHLSPQTQDAMKVNIAAQIMSHSMSAYLHSLCAFAQMPTSAMATATFTSQVDQLFDSFNGVSENPPSAKELRSWLTDQSKHTKFWKEASEFVSSWQYTGKRKNPPSQDGWLYSIKAIQLIWDYVKTLGLTHLRPRTFNQDPLENLFGGIRSSCGNNQNPTTTQFVSALKTQIINGLANRGLRGTNCEMDDLTVLSDLRSLIFDQVKNTPNIPVVASNDVDVSESISFANEVQEALSFGRSEILSVAYVSGFIARRLLSSLECKSCHTLLTSDSSNPSNLFISFKEYDNSSNFMTYPSEQLVKVVGLGITFLENHLDSHRSGFVEKRIISLLNEHMNFSWFKCDAHFRKVKDSIIYSVVRIGIKWYCTRFVRNVSCKRKRKSGDCAEDKHIRKIRILKHQ